MSTEQFNLKFDQFTVNAEYDNETLRFAEFTEPGWVVSQDRRKAVHENGTVLTIDPIEGTVTMTSPYLAIEPADAQAYHQRSFQRLRPSLSHSRRPYGPLKNYRKGR